MRLKQRFWGILFVFLYGTHNQKWSIASRDIFKILLCLNLLKCPINTKLLPYVLAHIIEYNPLY